MWWLCLHAYVFLVITQSERKLKGTSPHVFFLCVNLYGQIQGWKDTNTYKYCVWKMLYNFAVGPPSIPQLKEAFESPKGSPRILLLCHDRDLSSTEAFVSPTTSHIVLLNMVKLNWSWIKYLINYARWYKWKGKYFTGGHHLKHPAAQSSL